MAPGPPGPPHRQPLLAHSVSFQSSRSNEADDEYTVSGSPSMGPAGDPETAQYAGEDTRLTSKKELAGFYSYGWAAEVFVICGMGSFIPITLEQLARERGWLESDPTKPCVYTPLPPPTFNHTSADDASMKRESHRGQCIVSMLGVDINTASFAMYTFSISVLLQALIIMSMSAAADHGPFRKQLLLIFAFTGAIATMLFLPIVPDVFVLGAFLAIIANTCFGASFVLLNSFLPLLVRHHPSVQLRGTTIHDGRSHEIARPSNDGTEDPFLTPDDSVLDPIIDPTSPLLPSDGADHTSPYKRSAAAPSQELQLSTKISSYGIGIGYIAGLIVQISCIIMVGFMRSSTFSLRLSLFLIGAWWFVFSFPSAFWLRPRPGPPLHISSSTGRARSCLAYFTYSWRSLGRTITHARGLKDILLFLAAWFLLSDGIATVSGTAILFAKTSLEMKPPSLALISLIGTMAGVVGAFTWSRISALMGLKPSQTILACICLFEIIPLYGLLGYIPAVQRLGVLGLQRPWEMYPLGAIYGFVLGGLSSYCRSLFGELIPPGFEAAFYALYAVTDKGSSVFGPAIVGAITDATGDIRPAFWFLAVLIALPFPLMMMVNVERGRADGSAMAKELEDGKLQKSIGSDDGSDELSVGYEDTDEDDEDTPRRLSYG